MKEKNKQGTKRYSVTFDEKFARRIDALAHFKGLSTTQYIRMVVMDHVYGKSISIDSLVDDELPPWPWDRWEVGRVDEK